MQPGIDYIGVSTPFYCNDGKGNFLFHKRSKNCRDEQGKWDTGSGQLEFGLTPKKNVLKEVKEEYGCRAIIQKKLPAHSILRVHNGKKTHWLVIPFFVLVDPKKVKINDKDKIEKIAWRSLNNLPQLLHTGFAFSFRSYRKYFEKYII
jgi:ADP-ribose pyrophosphatase YjhB (NUDIX family)